MKPSVFTLSEGIYRIYSDEIYNSEHLSQPILIFFQRFKEAYESKNIIELKNYISHEFQGDIYGTNKKEFINLIKYNFDYLSYRNKPHLIIEFLNILSSSDSDFYAEINIKSNLQFLEILKPGKHNMEKLYCEVKLESDNYWKITKLIKFTKVVR